MSVATTKIQYKHLQPYRVQRNLQAWEAFCGIWKNKQIGNVVNWQKQIRKEWERALPKLNLK